ncbi:MAG: hypothetical protein HW383_775 [Candidatus Magasanikbacteria bacterium]|nr:hypothetical protein [Candidatus Magasanikbacteria bacterium]
MRRESNFSGRNADEYTTQVLVQAGIKLTPERIQWLEKERGTCRIAARRCRQTARVQVAAGTPEADVDAPTVKLHRKRGRPRIHPLPDPNAPRRGPGRPRKQSVPDAHDP